MALKAVLDKGTYDGLDSNLKTLYREDGGKFYLDFEGAEDHTAVRGIRSALEGERKKTSTVERELAELREKIGDMDPAAAKEALKKLKELEDATNLGDIPERFKKQFETAVEHRVAQMKADFENQRKSYDKKVGDQDGTIKTLNSKLEELMIDNGVRSEAAKLGLHDWAIEDAVLRARQVYHIRDGKPVPIRPGTKDEIIYGKDPKEPQPIAEWLTDEVMKRPGWLQSSNGGGAQNDRNANPGKEYRIKREDARDTKKYTEAKEKAEKAGQTLVIVD